MSSSCCEIFDGKKFIDRQTITEKAKNYIPPIYFVRGGGGGEGEGGYNYKEIYFSHVRMKCKKNSLWYGINLFLQRY